MGARSGERAAGEKRSGAQTIMDGINGPAVGARPLDAVLAYRDIQAVSVNDDGAIQAMRIAFDNLKLVLEPARAASLAAVMVHSRDFKGKNVVVVASGGNVDATVFRRALM